MSVWWGVSTVFFSDRPAIGVSFAAHSSLALAAVAGIEIRRRRLLSYNNSTTAMRAGVCAKRPYFPPEGAKAGAFFVPKLLNNSQERL